MNVTILWHIFKDINGSRDCYLFALMTELKQVEDIPSLNIMMDEQKQKIKQNCFTELGDVIAVPIQFEIDRTTPYL